MLINFMQFVLVIVLNNFELLNNFHVRPTRVGNETIINTNLPSKAIYAYLYNNVQILSRLHDALEPSVR